MYESISDICVKVHIQSQSGSPCMSEDYKKETETHRLTDHWKIIADIAGKREDVLCILNRPYIHELSHLEMGEPEYNRALLTLRP